MNSNNKEGLGKFFSFFSKKTDDTIPAEQPVERKSSVYDMRVQEAMWMPTAEEQQDALRVLADEFFAAEPHEADIPAEDALKFYKNGGFVLGILGQYDKAIAYYDCAVAANADDSYSYFGRGNVWRDNGEYQKAIMDYKRAIAIEPENADFFCQMGAAYLQMGIYNEAIDCYSKAIDINPYSSVNLAGRALAYLQTNKWDEALVDYDAAIDLEPFDSELFYGRADKAIDAYSTAIDNQPESPLYYYGRGQAYLANGEEEKALADLEKSKVLDDTNTILIQEQMDRTKVN